MIMNKSWKYNNVHKTMNMNMSSLSELDDSLIITNSCVKVISKYYAICYYLISYTNYLQPTYLTMTEFTTNIYRE